MRWDIASRCAVAAAASAVSSMLLAATPSGGYTSQTLGLTGPGYEYTSKGTVYRTSVGQRLNAAGQATGISRGYSAAGDMLGEEAWIWTGSTTQRLGLTGTGYEYNHPSGAIWRLSAASALNSQGIAIGGSTRISSDGTSLGDDSWIWNGSQVLRLGLSGPEHQYTIAAGVYRKGIATYLNDSGFVSGTNARYYASGQSAGRDAWVFNGTTTQRIGLSGMYYENPYPYSGTAIVDNDVRGMNASGQVIGHALRSGTAGGSLGQDVWLWNGTTTRSVGLTGAQYEYNSGYGGKYRYADVEVSGFNADGDVTGFSRRYTSGGTAVGQDAWIWNGTSTTRIGLIGNGYEYVHSSGGTYRQSGPGEVNAAGQVRGVSSRFNASGTGLGQDAWFYNGSSIQQVGLVGPGYEYTHAQGGTYRYSNASRMNNAGIVQGDSQRYNASGTYLGNSTWVWDGSMTREAGLSGSGYEYSTGGGIYRASFASGMNASGRVVGTTDRYNSSGTRVGEDTWFWTGSQTRQIGLTGGVHQYVGTDGEIHRDSHPQAVSSSQVLNDAGQAIGYSRRYTSTGGDLGYSGWFYDDDTDATLALVFSVRDDQYSNTIPHVLTDEGVVLGRYTLYAANGSDQGLHAFWWSQQAGFYDLGALTSDFSADGWAQLAEVVAGSGTGLGDAPRYVLGNGFLAGKNAGQATFLLSTLPAVPEPTAVGAVLTASAMLLRRQRRIF